MGSAESKEKDAGQEQRQHLPPTRHASLPPAERRVAGLARSTAQMRIEGDADDAVVLISSHQVQPPHSLAESGPTALPSSSSSSSISSGTQPRYSTVQDLSRQVVDRQALSQQPATTNPPGRYIRADDEVSFVANPSSSQMRVAPEVEKGWPAASTPSDRPAPPTPVAEAAKAGSSISSEKPKPTRDTIRFKGSFWFEGLESRPAIRKIVLEDMPMSELPKLGGLLKSRNWMAGLEELRVQLQHGSQASTIFYSGSPSQPRADPRNAIKDALVDLGREAVKLRVVDLSENSFTLLPDELRSLARVQELNVSFNRLREVPECVVAMSSLVKLDLSHNEIEKWDNLGRMRRLTHLSLAFNKIKLAALPKQITQLQNLRELNISGMELQSIRSDLCGKLIQLEVLRASKNKLAEWPQGLFDLHELRVLDLSHNELVGRVPAAMGRLRKLSKLSLNNNKLESMAAEVCWCRELKKIKVVSNKWEKRLECLEMGLAAYSVLLILRHHLQREGKDVPQFKFVNEISEEQIAVHTDELLGRGKFADVFACSLPGQEAGLAVKQFRPETGGQASTDAEQEEGQHAEAKEIEVIKFAREVGIMSLLNEKHALDGSAFIRMVGICTSGGRKWIIMERAHCTLRDLINTWRFQGSMSDKLEVARGVVQALRALGDSLHGDLHTGNILLKSRAVKLGDFGLSRHGVKNFPRSCCAKLEDFLKSTAYIPCSAPEVLSYSEFSKAADIFSFGVVLYHIFSHNHPMFPDTPPEVIAVKITKGERPVIGVMVPWGVRVLIRACWEHEAWRRPRANVLNACLFYLRRAFELEGEKCDFFDEDYGRSAFKVPGDSLSFWHLWRLLHERYHREGDDTEVDTTPTN